MAPANLFSKMDKHSWHWQTQLISKCDGLVISKGLW